LNHNAVAFVSNNPSFVGYFAFGVSSGMLRILEATHWTGVASRAKLATPRHLQHRCSLSRPGLEWLGSRVVSVLDSGAEGPGSNRSRDAAKLVAALLSVAGVTLGLAESNGSLPPGL